LERRQAPLLEFGDQKFEELFSIRPYLEDISREIGLLFKDTLGIPDPVQPGGVV
jgi:hypothetical protein